MFYEEDIFFLLLYCVFSCSNTDEKYHANWIIDTYEVDGKDQMDWIGSYNFLIDLEEMKVTPSGVFDDKGNIKLVKSDIVLYKENGKDYFLIEKHPNFAGVFEVVCEDKECCSLILKGKRTKIELIYNGDIPFGKTRNCPDSRNLRTSR